MDLVTNDYYYSDCLMGIIHLLSVYIYYSEFFLSKSSLTPLHLFIYSIIYMGIDSQIFYAMEQNPIISLFILLLKLLELWPLGAPSGCPLCSFNKYLSFSFIFYLIIFSTPLFSGTMRCSRVILCFPYPVQESSFFK